MNRISQQLSECWNVREKDEMVENVNIQLLFK